MNINVFEGRLTVFGLVGEDSFRRLVHAFYSRVYEDPLLRHLFPDDRDAVEDRLSLFLMQYFGGPTTYSDRRGHPRMRMRHLPFSIGQEERDAWLGHMLAAVDEVGIAEPARAAMIEYFEHAATF